VIRIRTRCGSWGLPVSNGSQTPSIKVSGDGEIVCSPVGNVPSEEMLRQIMATVRRQIPVLFIHIHPEDREEFQSKGWIVAGIDSNFYGLGNHALKMRYRL
jgi:hypothetical protein